MTSDRHSVSLTRWLLGHRSALLLANLIQSTKKINEIKTNQFVHIHVDKPRVIPRNQYNAEMFLPCHVPFQSYFLLKGQTNLNGTW